MKDVTYVVPALGSKYFTYSYFGVYGDCVEVSFNEKPYVIRRITITKEDGITVSGYDNGCVADSLRDGIYPTLKAAAEAAAYEVGLTLSECTCPEVTIYGVHTAKGRKTVEKAFKGIKIAFIDAYEGW